MDLIVTTESTNATEGVLSAGRIRLVCALGRGGVTLDKREGDGATPIGRFALRSVLYRPDRVATPRTGLITAPIAPEDGWCNDPGDPSYNTPVKLPYAARCEALWRDDALYDALVVLGHNDSPPIPGAGSAIFLHVARQDHAPTEGCVALERNALLRILALCGPDDFIRVSPPGHRDSGSKSR